MVYIHPVQETETSQIMEDDHRIRGVEPVRSFGIVSRDFKSGGFDWGEEWDDLRGVVRWCRGFVQEHGSVPPTCVLDAGETTYHGAEVRYVPPVGLEKSAGGRYYPDEDLSICWCTREEG